MTSRNHVACETHDQVARVALDRPEKFNGLTLDMLDELVALTARLRKDRSLRAVVITGNGESFCAGLDFGSALREPARIAATFVPRPWRGTNNFQEACWGFRRLNVPVIAVVHGHCFGGGVQIALAADFRFTTPDSQWSVLESKWGLIPDMSGIQSLSEQVRMDTAKRLTMTGEVVSGVEAVELGLASGVSADPAADAEALLAKLRERSPDSVAAAKRLFNSTWSRGPRRTFARERLEQLVLLGLGNTKAARSAAMRRAQPTFAPRAIR